MRTGRQTLPFAGRSEGEISPLNAQLGAEGDGPGAQFRSLRMPRAFQGLSSAGVVGQPHFQRAQHGHASVRAALQVLADAEFQQLHLHPVVLLGDADAPAELANGAWADAAPPQPGQGGHARIVPALHRAGFHQLQQQTLAHRRVFQAQPGEFDLRRMDIQAELIQHPVVQGPVILEFQGAKGVGDALQGIADAMREIVGWVDVPSASGALMGRMANAVQHRVAQIHVRRGHVDPGPQHMGAIGEFASAHGLEQRPALGAGTVPIGAFPPRFRQAAPGLANFLLRQAANIGPALADQFQGAVVQGLEVVRGESQPIPPIEAQPSQILLNGLGVFGAFLERVGVVEAQIGAAAVLLGDAEVQADALGMADVQIAVGLRRKPGHHPAFQKAVSQIPLDALPDEIGAHEGFSPFAAADAPRIAPAGMQFLDGGCR